MNTLTKFFVSILLTIAICPVILKAVVDIHAVKSAAIIIGSVVGPQIASGFIGLGGRALEERYSFDGLSDRTIMDKALHKIYNSAMIIGLSAGSFYIALPHTNPHIATASALMASYWYACGRLSYMYGESDRISELYMKFRYIPVFASAIIAINLFPQFSQHLSVVCKLSTIGSAFTLSALPE